MKILFIYKNFYIYEFKGIPQLAAILKKEGHEVRLALSEKEDVLKIIKKWKPDIVGYSITTGFHRYYLNLNKRLKEKVKFYSIFGGPHATYFPEIINEEGVDAVCIGEGDEAMVDFVNAFGTKRMRYIKNWLVKDNGKIYKNDVRPLIEDLDKLPFLDRELLYSKDNFLKNNLLKTFIFSRGCFNRCTYCHNASYLEIYKNKGKIFRTRSPESAVSEIELVKKNYPVGIVRFNDDFFGISQDWLREFCKKYKEKINLPFHCAIAVNTATEERIKLLKEAGCVSLQLGLETGVEEMRNKLIKKWFKNEQYIRACKLLNKYGIKVILNNIIGLPGESVDTVLETLRFNIKCKPFYSWCTIYQPYPKTPLAEFAQKKGYFDGDYDKVDHSYYRYSILKFKNKNEKRQIENLHKLFAITVSFPFLYPITRQLIKLPPNLIFNLIYKIWYGYTHQYLFPQKMRVLQRLKTIKRFFVKDEA